MIDVTFYIRPNGKTITVACANVLKEDEEFFKENDIRISAEELPGDIKVVYATKQQDQGELEFIEFDEGRTFQEVLACLSHKMRAALI